MDTTTKKVKKVKKVIEKKLIIEEEKVVIEEEKVVIEEEIKEKIKEKKNIQIINNDCILELEKLPDNSIDLVLTDPPYFNLAKK